MEEIRCHRKEDLTKVMMWNRNAYRKESMEDENNRGGKKGILDYGRE